MMYSFWNMLCGFVWRPRNEAAVVATEENGDTGTRAANVKELDKSSTEGIKDMENGQEGDAAVATRDVQDKEDNDGKEHEDEDEDENGIDSDDDGDDEDDDGDDDDGDIPVVTIHPDCGFTVDESFECPLSTESRFTLAAAYKSATDGCPCCILHYTAIRSVAPEFPDSAMFSGAHDYIFLPFWVEKQRFVLAWDDNDNGEKFTKPPFNDEDMGQNSNFYGDILGGIELIEHVVPCDTSSAKTLATVQRWIKKCDEGHDCMRHSNQKLPRRVLDVRNNRIKLRETTSADHGAKYACLSHCWGTPSTEIMRVCTTPATIMSYYEDIPFDILPRTFKDAVSFTRDLDVPFLWIDSFCIIQNEPGKKDWYEQSGNMANIYQNAYVTLAAAVSKNPTGGCYTREDSPLEHKIGKPVAAVHYSDGTESDVFARRMFRHDANSLPLLKRGWVYQERILSPRIVYFAGEELVWECHESIDCECGGDGLEDRFERIRISDLGEDRVIGPCHQHPKPMRLWYQIVHDYKALSLSHGSDMLPGLSGIAKVFQERIGDEYVAGMWRRTLLSNLLWYFMEEEEEKRVADPEERPWTAPSWSWASRACTSKVHFLPVTSELAEVKDVVCQPSGADPTGELESDAHLTLVTAAVPVTLERGPDTPKSPYTIRLDNDFTISPTSNSHSWSVSGLGTGYLDLDESKPLQPHDSVEILLAQIATCTADHNLNLSDVHERYQYLQEVRSYMLLARDSHDSNNNRWTRIGVATIAAYEYETFLFGPDGKTFTHAEIVERLKQMARKDIVSTLEKGANRNRAIFQRFDDTETRDLVVW
jgi:hypothetical protein